ncbi:MAG: ABC transporter permease [Phascolarctobacterium sp.]
MDALKRFWRKIKFIIIKELLCTIKDPLTRTVLFFPIIVQSLLFGYAATFNLDNVPYALLDQSHSAASTELVAHIEGTGIFERTSTITSTSQIADCIDSGDALMVLVIGQDFADKLANGEQAAVQILLDGRNSTTASVAAGYIANIISSFNASLNGGALPLAIKSISWYNPNFITRWMFIPSMLPLLSLIQVILLAGLSVAREKEQGTFDQLLVTPLSPKEILLGKAIPPILIGLFQVTLVLLIGIFWFEIPFMGSLITLYITLFIFLVSCVGIGLSISAIASNMQQVMVYCFVLLLPMAQLSGFATPVSNMPEILQYATYANPLRFAIEAVRCIYLEGATLSQVAHNFPPMLAVAAITMPTAAWLFRNKLG